MDKRGLDDLSQPLDGVIREGQHRYRLRVQYADTDFSGAVYHARYLEFLERGRSDFLRLSGLHHASLLNDDPALARYWVVRRMEIDYRASARIEDVIHVETRIADLGGARIAMAQCIGRADTMLIEARVSAALIDGTGRPKRFPKDWVERFKALMAEATTDKATTDKGL